MKELPCYIERKKMNPNPSVIPRNLIQTFKHNVFHEKIYDNVMGILAKNPDFNYYLITDDIGVALIKEHFDSAVLEAFDNLNVGAAKGDFLRYIAMYVYGGVYLDMDSTITISLSEFIEPNIQHLLFLDGGFNIPQWCFMIAPKHPMMLKIIHETVRRITRGEDNIFLATGPTLFTDCVFNYMNKSDVYNTGINVSKTDRGKLFLRNARCLDGLMLYEENLALNLKEKFRFTFQDYNKDLLYTDEKRYIPTWGRPTPNLYKKQPQQPQVPQTLPWTFRV
jgi:mannosyltransferase OCH1-like enzyme